MAVNNTRVDRRSLEDRIVGLAMRGKLARIGRRAVAAQRAAGLPVTFQRGDQVLRELPDGTVEVLETIPKVSYEVPIGVRRLRRP